MLRDQKLQEKMSLNAVCEVCGYPAFCNALENSDIALPPRYLCEEEAVRWLVVLNVETLLSRINRRKNDVSSLLLLIDNFIKLRKGG